MFSLIIWLVMGGVAGWLAGKIMNSSFSTGGNILLGIGGGIVGPWVLEKLGMLEKVSTLIGPEWVGDILVSAIGACILILIGRLFKK